MELIIPPVLLLGAGVSAWRQSRASTLFEEAAAGGVSTVKGMSWSAFEQLVAEGFRRQGYTVCENIVGGPDGGVDLALSKGGKRYLVQCKQWHAWWVGVSVVRELKGVIAVSGADGGFVVTSGNFTAEAMAFAAKANIELLDGQRLMGLIRHADQPPLSDEFNAQTGITPNTAAPGCPNCGRVMVTRTARRGANPGKQFWGCPGFPSCNGTRAM